MSCANWCARSLLQEAGAAAVVFGREPRDADDAFACSNQLEEFLQKQAGLAKGHHSPRPHLGCETLHLARVGHGCA